MHPCSRDPSTAARAVAPAALVAALLLVPAGGAGAAYFGLDGSAMTLGDGGGAVVDEDDPDPRGGRLRLGARLGDRLDVELHAGRSSAEDGATFERLRVGWIGAYLKAYLPVGSRSALYALGGVAGARVGRELGGREIEDERGGLSYGAGLETELTERIDLSADWVRYLDDEGGLGEVDAVSIGLKLYF